MKNKYVAIWNWNSTSLLSLGWFILWSHQNTLEVQIQTSRFRFSFCFDPSGKVSMSDTIQNKMLKRLLWRLWLTLAMWVSYYPLHKPASSWFSLGFFHSFPLTFQTKFQVRSHDIYCTTFPHINFVVWHSWKMRTNFDARSSREEQPIVATFTLLTFFSFSFVLCKKQVGEMKVIQDTERVQTESLQLYKIKFVRQTV